MAFETPQLFNQLPLGSPLVATDIVAIQRANGNSYRVLGSDINPMTTLGDMITGGSSPAGVVTRLAGNTTTIPLYLKSIGSGSLATAPAWTQIAGGDLAAGGTFPAINSGSTLVTNPTTSTITALNTALANIHTAGSGTVSTVSVVTANGLAGTVATATTTPAITLSTTVTGMVKGNATALLPAVSGTDYSAGTSGLATGILKTTTTTGVLSIATGADFPTGINASTVTTTVNSSNASFFVPFVALSTTSDQALFVDSGINYNPSTNVLTATTFVGNLTGTALLASDIAGNSTNTLLYQAGNNDTAFLATANNGVLVTNGSGVPSIGTTLPAVNSNATLVTNPFTSTTTALSTALSDIYTHGAGTGTVTSVSVVTANGFGGSVATATTTPAITLTTSAVGVVIGNGTAIVGLAPVANSVLACNGTPTETWSTTLPPVIASFTLVPDPTASGASTALGQVLTNIYDEFDSGLYNTAPWTINAIAKGPDFVVLSGFVEINVTIINTQTASSSLAVSSLGLGIPGTVQNTVGPASQMSSSATPAATWAHCQVASNNLTVYITDAINLGNRDVAFSCVIRW